MKHEEIWLKAPLAALHTGSKFGGTDAAGAAQRADNTVMEYIKRFPSASACMWENCPCSRKHSK